MNGHDIIVIGASSGGLEALTEVASKLPAAVFILLSDKLSEPVDKAQRT